MGQLMGHCGKFREAVQHLERAIDLYHPVQNRNCDSLSGVDAKSHTLAVLSRRSVCSVTRHGTLGYVVVWEAQQPLALREKRLHSRAGGC